MWVTLDSRVMGWRRGQKGLNLAFPFPYSFLLFLLDRCFLIQALLCVRYHALSWGYSDEWRRRWCWFLGIYSLVREGQSSMAVEQTAPTGWVVRVRISSPPSLLGQAFRSDSEGQPGSAPEYLRPHPGTRTVMAAGPCVQGLCCGNGWVLWLFFMSHFLGLTCLRWLLHSHTWNLGWMDGWRRWGWLVVSFLYAVLRVWWSPSLVVLG